jgi:hypothetical protein
LVIQLAPVLDPEIKPIAGEAEHRRSDEDAGGE